MAQDLRSQEDFDLLSFMITSQKRQELTSFNRDYGLDCCRQRTDTQVKTQHLAPREPQLKVNPATMQSLLNSKQGICIQVLLTAEDVESANNASLLSKLDLRIRILDFNIFHRPSTHRNSHRQITLYNNTNNCSCWVPYLEYMFPLQGFSSLIHCLINKSHEPFQPNKTIRNSGKGIWL